MSIANWISAENILSAKSEKKEWIIVQTNYYPRLRDLREDHDITQRQIAGMLGMKQTQYFRYEQGYRDIPTDMLIRLSDIYSVSVDYILGLTDEQTRYPR